MIYVDFPMTFDIRFKDYCHLWSSEMDVDELLSFGDKLGLKRGWLQCSRSPRIKEFYHFDISPNKRAQALRLGATYKNLAEWINERVGPLVRSTTDDDEGSVTG